MVERKRPNDEEKEGGDGEGKGGGGEEEGRRRRSIGCERLIGSTRWVRREGRWYIGDVVHK